MLLRYDLKMILLGFNGNMVNENFWFSLGTAEENTDFVANEF